MSTKTILKLEPSGASLEWTEDDGMVGGVLYEAGSLAVEDATGSVLPFTVDEVEQLRAFLNAGPERAAAQRKAAREGVEFEVVDGFSAILIRGQRIELSFEEQCAIAGWFVDALNGKGAA